MCYVHEATGKDEEGMTVPVHILKGATYPYPT